MVNASITFFILAILAYVLGANGIAGVSMEIGKFLLVAFIILAVISFIASLITGKRNTHIP